jgi:hypothetical protein
MYSRRPVTGSVLISAALGSSISTSVNRRLGTQRAAQAGGLADDDLWHNGCDGSQVLLWVSRGSYPPARSGAAIFIDVAEFDRQPSALDKIFHAALLLSVSRRIW